MQKAKTSKNTTTANNVVVTKKKSRNRNKRQQPKSLVAELAPILGGAFGSLFGQPVAGAKIASLGSKLFGFGDYTITSNSLMTDALNPDAAEIPKFGNSRNAIRVREREFLGDVISSSSSSTFQNMAYPIDPTNNQTFPWLSQIASLFDQWVPHGVVFEFVSTSSEFNAVGQSLGTVVLATDYDSTHSLFTTKQGMENSDFANSTKSSCSAIHGIECDPSQRPLPVMYTNNANSNFQSLGNFQLATAGISTGSVTLGELWVSYDISFMKKILEPPAPSSMIMTVADGTVNSTGWWLSGVNSGSFNPGSVATISGTGQALYFNNTDSGGVYYELLYSMNIADSAPSESTMTLTNLTQVNETPSIDGSLTQWIYITTGAGASITQTTPSAVITDQWAVQIGVCSQYAGV